MNNALKKNIHIEFEEFWENKSTIKEFIREFQGFNFVIQEKVVMIYNNLSKRTSFFNLDENPMDFFLKVREFCNLIN